MLRRNEASTAARSGVRRTSRAAAVAMAVMGTVVLAGCGSGGGSSSSSAGASGSTWTIGVMYDLTGTGAATTAGAEASTQFAVNAINAKGGIRGHKIIIQTCDDQSTTQGGATCGSQLADVNSHVVIVLGSNPPSQGAETQLTGDLGLAISAVLLPPKGTTMFQANGLGSQVISPTLQQAAKEGIHTLGVIYTSDSPGEGQLKAAQSVAPKYGIKIVSEPMDPTATDVTPQLLKLKEAGAQMFYTATLGTSTNVILSSYHALKLTLPIAVAGGNVNNNFLKSIPFALPKNLYGGGSNLMLGPDYPTPAIHSAWQAFASAWKKAEPNYPIDQEVATSTYAWCLAQAALTGTNGGSATAMASYLRSHTTTCLGAPIEFNNPKFNAPANVPSSIVQAGVTAADGWGPLRTKL